VQPKRPAHYLWAVLIARIYEVFPLLCPICKVKGARLDIFNLAKQIEPYILRIRYCICGAAV
jgi:hypothetical protein